MTRNREEGGFSAQDSTPPPKHGIDPASLKYVVLAGNMREFHQWQQRYQVQGGEALYVTNPHILLGRNFTENPDLRLIIIGTFHLRKDTDEILDELRTRLPGKAPEYQPHYPIPPTP